MSWKRRLHGRHVGAVLLLGADFLEIEHDVDERIGPRVVAGLQRRMNGDRVLRPYVDKARGEAARAHRAQRRLPSLSQAAYPDDIGAGAADRLRETKRGWGGPFDPGHTL